MSRGNQAGVPGNARKVFDGQIFDVYQWEQELYDGTQAVFEKLKRDDTGVVIAVTEDKKIIMLKQEQPMKAAFVGLPGGRLENNEDPQQGTRRELNEETGYDSNEWELYYKIDPYNKIHWTIYCYIARNCKKISEQHLDAGEKIEVKLIDFDQFIDIVLDDKCNEWELKVKIMKAMMAGKLEEFKNYLLSNNS